MKNNKNARLIFVTLISSADIALGCGGKGDPKSRHATDKSDISWLFKS